MATQDGVLYKIDYSTTLSQPDSKLCSMPTEILREIGKATISPGEFALQEHPPAYSFTARSKARH